MKKVLLATTALVATAGIAAAEVTVKGYAEMGIAGGSRYEGEGKITNPDTGVTRKAKGNGDPTFWQEFEVIVDGSGETDSGMTFGFHVEIEDGNTPFRTNGSLGVGDLIGFDTGDTDYTGDGGPSIDNESVFISGAFGTLTMGEIDGAFDKRLKEVALAGGTIADDETEHAGYNGNSGLDGKYDNQILRYDYEFGDFGVSASVEQDDVETCTFNTGTAADCKTTTDSEIWGIGLSYNTSFGDTEIGLGLGYQTSDDLADYIGVSLTAGFGGFEAGINYTDISDNGAFGGDDDGQHLGIGLAYTLDAWTFAGNWGEFDWDNDDRDADGYGLLVQYDLGGGAAVHLGYGDGEDEDSYSFGLSMSF